MIKKIKRLITRIKAGNGKIPYEIPKQMTEYEFVDLIHNLNVYNKEIFKGAMVFFHWKDSNNFVLEIDADIVKQISMGYVNDVPEPLKKFMYEVMRKGYVDYVNLECFVLKIKRKE